jgi:RHH-type proline utilization regulon transcriptional repressor/proline dehydrogenase/delta 1-pyrroline-5-carboxylate dehydrogenase
MVGFDLPFANEPLADFGDAEVRDRFAAGVSAAMRAPAFDAPVIVGGEHLPTDGVIESVDPGQPGRVVCRAGRAGAGEVNRAVEAAARAQSAWAATSPRDRADVLVRAAATMREQREELAGLEVTEAGKPWTQADADVCEAIDFCEYYAREAMRLAVGAPVLQAPGESNAYAYRPRGIVAVIAPWNFPLAIPCGMVSAGLVCGNTVIFKPAEQTPGVAFRLAEILYEAGVPSGVLAFLPGLGEEAGAVLVEHPQVSIIAFTGSKDVGLGIVERAGVTAPGQRHVKRVIAEMGGKNAIVVDNDADLDLAVPAIVDSAFGYAGQKCSAASRLIAVGEVFDAVVDRLVEAARSVPVGHPSDPAVVVGPVIDEDAFRRIGRYTDIARDEGKVLLQRNDIPDTGWFVGPTVAVCDDPGARIATEEIFGPFIVGLRARDFDEALEIANATPYALTGGVFSRSPAHIGQASEQMRAGNVYINRKITGALVGRQPFGGYGLSGVGSKAGGPDYLLQFCEPRVITENTARP